MAFDPDRRLGQVEANQRLDALLQEYGRVLLENTHLRLRLQKAGE